MELVKYDLDIVAAARTSPPGNLSALLKKSEREHTIALWTLYTPLPQVIVRSL